jgi:hypothetical protein
MIDTNALRPFGIWKATLKARFPWQMTETEKEIWVAHEKCYNKLLSEFFENSRLREENLRLKHENEFMLRQINERDQ